MCKLRLRVLLSLVVMVMMLEAVDRAVLVGLGVGVEFVSDLPAGLTSSELAALLEAGVPIDPDLAAVDDLQIEAVDRLLSFLSGGVLNKAEAAGSLLALVESHDQVDNLATQTEELQQLSLVGVERQVSHVERRRELQPLAILLRAQIFKEVSS